MSAAAIEAIDMTPTWGEWGSIYSRLAESGEKKAVRHLRADFARACAASEALKQLQDTLSDEQQGIVARVLSEELTKQGY